VAVPVRADLVAIHERQIAALGDPGTWFTGGQRLTTAREARAARCAEEPEIASANLPAAAVRVARQLAVDPKRVDQGFYSQAIGDGLTDAEYVEIVGLVSRITNFDVLARGIDMAAAPLPKPNEGEPSRDRPETAAAEGAWVPTIPNGRRGGEFGRELYGAHMMPFIVRALSLVPRELKHHVELEEVQYLPLARFFQFDHQQHEGLSRPQVEVVAARVSAFNECFYCTASHALALRGSGRVIGQEFEVKAIVQPELDVGVDGGAQLMAFADAVLGTDGVELDRARKALAAHLTPAAVSAASIIAANFSKNDRIADGLSIPMERPSLAASAELREALGSTNIDRRPTH
jgi:AhpD family alkylhydroperoxidase